MQAGVVEEVVEVKLPAALGRLLDVAGRDRLPGQHIVHDHGDPVLGARLDDVSDVGFEGRIATLVLDDLGAVHPGHRPVSGGVEAQDDPLTGPAGGHPELGLIPDIAHVVPDFGVGEDVVVAGRHRYLTGAGEWAVPPALGATDAFGVEAELPEPVERLALAAHRVLGSKHSTHLPAEAMACWTRYCAAATISPTQ